VYDALEAHIAVQRRAPTVRELGSALGITSTSTVAEHIRKLKHKGYVCGVPSSARSLALTDSPAACEAMFARSESNRKQAGREILAAVGFDNPAYGRVRGIVDRLLLNNVEAVS
jgi:repressor LexA